MTSMILWFFLMVPTQKCLEDFNAEPKPSIYIEMVPHTISFHTSTLNGEEPKVNIRNEDDCYDVFVSTIEVGAVPYKPSSEGDK